MRNYIGLIHKEDGSDYGVSFPDFPGAVTAARTLEEARSMAEDVLALHVEGMIEDGDVIPNPSTLDEIMKSGENREAVAILVQLRTPAPKAVRVNVTLPEDVLAQIDAYASSHGYTRSGFLASAVRRAIVEDAA